MPRIISVRPLQDYRLAVRFDDGPEGIIDMRDRLFGPAFEPLKDPAVFQQVFVDEFGAVAWPNGADLAPDALHERLRETSEI
jgi:tRNA U34 5-methylaminomethyl-2-thiouridine-forming methyltransferase MnmC